MHIDARIAELMLDATLGRAPAAVGLAIATFVELQPAAARTQRGLQALGGALLDDLDPVPLAADSLQATLSRLDEEAVEPAVTAPGPRGSAPVALQPYVGADYEKVRWRPRGHGAFEHVIWSERGGYRASLLRIAPGRRMLTHRHSGEELTLVIEGSYWDAQDCFRRGNLQVATTAQTHAPRATAQGCLCLTVLAAPLRLTGLLGWIVNPFIRH